MPDPADRKVHEHPIKQAANDGLEEPYVPAEIPYAELTVASNYSFLAGASHPDELSRQAARLGYRAIALTDCNTLAGIVRAHVAAKDAGIPFVVGCRLRFIEPAGLSLFVYPTDRAAYGRLCRLLTLGKRRAEKAQCHLWLDDLAGYTDGWLAIAWFANPADETVNAAIDRLRAYFDDDRLSLALARLFTPNDADYRDATIHLSRQTGIPLVAVNDVHYHIPERGPLHDVLTCIRHGCTLDTAGMRLFSNVDRYLKSPAEMQRLFADHPQALTRTVEIARRAAGFSLDQLRYEYPREACPNGVTPMQHLRDLTLQGAHERYPAGIPAKVLALLEHEFKLIEELSYAPYFLTVHWLVKFARARQILCQGRGAAANSAVCFCLGITSVDPDRSEMLFERFVSRERDEPPDIDIDFEHERREEVIQHIYSTYGRDRAGLTAEVITYRTRSSVRDVGKALGLSLDVVDRIAKHVHDWHGDGLTAEKLLGLGLDPTDRTLRLFARLLQIIAGFPRHLGQHVGGFVISEGPLCELVPIENAAMEDRTVIEWDKDDIEALGMMKVDVLALGMLTCIRKSLDLIREHHGRELNLATIPAEDPRVYDMICKADTVGVFQIESRAQMTMLPRLKPRNFYDLVIEVAIVRPGPIVGDMVHPFLRRRNGQEPVVYPDKKVERVLSRTLGVPLFQEQAMALAIVAAGFTPGEAEMLRRTISAWKSRGKDAIPRYRARFIRGMVGNGYELKFAEQCFERLKGFSEYGFPESHASSFALLVYASAWIKCYYPAVFAAALLNSQPMGFYAPAQIVRDARDHGVAIQPVDVNRSGWDCTLEDAGNTDRAATVRERDFEQEEKTACLHARLDPPNATNRAATVRERDFEQEEKTACLHARLAPPNATNRAATVRERDFEQEEKPACLHARLAPPNATNRAATVRERDFEQEEKPACLHARLGRPGNTVRLGMRMVRGLREAEAQMLSEAVRRRGPFSSIVDLWRNSEVSAATLYALALADAFGSMGLDRQQALWAVQSLRGKPLPLFDSPQREPEPSAPISILPPVSPSNEVFRDYRAVGLSVKAHPMSFARDYLRKKRILTAADIRDERRCPHGCWASVAGIVLFRQRPGTAKGTMFMTLEDETGRADLIVRPRIYERDTAAAIHGSVVLARGRVERNGLVVHVLASRITELPAETLSVAPMSRDFR